MVQLVSCTAALTSGAASNLGGRMFGNSPTSPFYSTGVIAPSVASNHPSGNNLLDRCSSGAPPQWRQFLDAPSKAHLAPCVVFATLRHINLTTIQLAASNANTVVAQLRQAPGNTFNPQNVNQVGVNIETVFEVQRVLKNTFKDLSLRSAQSLRLMFRISGSLATTNALINLTDLGQASQQPEVESTPFNWSQQLQHRTAAAPSCAFELNNEEDLFARKQAQSDASLFKIGKEYVLFLDQSSFGGSIGAARNQWQYELTGSGLPRRNSATSNGFEAAARHQHSSAVHPFATHEPLSTGTSRAIYRILCKGCARAPQVELVNSTLVSGSSTQLQTDAASTTSKRRIRLDCKVSGKPAPWVQWYRNGKLLRNKAGRWQMKTSKPNKRRDSSARISRLELELASGRNETGVYECRAMSVAAREPAVGAYTLLVLQDNFALIPMHASPTPTPHTEEAWRRPDRPAAPHLTTQSTPTTPVAATIAPTTTTTTAAPHSSPAANLTTTSRPSQQVPSQNPTASTTTNAPESQRKSAEQQQDLSQQAQPTKTRPTQATSATPQKHPHKATSGNRKEPTKSVSEVGRADSNAAGSDSNHAVGQPCPGIAGDLFCFNKGTCVLIGHIEEYFCNCAEGYHGHRCEYKSLGHQSNAPH